MNNETRETSWLTLFGVIAAMGTVLTGAQEVWAEAPSWLVLMGKVLAAAGVAALGFRAVGPKKES